jgi:leucyl/phenylalanyl-tRNA---protein transferase
MTTTQSENSLLPWLEPGQTFPPASQAWGTKSPVPGLLCAGNDLRVDTLQSAYAQGIFPWYSEGQPPLWWSPDPRMVLHVDEFRVHPSLKKTLRNFAKNPLSEIRIDSAFEEVIRACSSSPREGQSGTWIVPEMIDAYIEFHRAGFAHSVETWTDGRLIGGLYCVNIGQAVFGESMFHRATDGSKIALCALVALCRHHHMPLIDCQQNTHHLASLGAREISRTVFVNNVTSLTSRLGPAWVFEPVYWNELAAPNPANA